MSFSMEMVESKASYITSNFIIPSKPVLPSRL